MGGLRYPLCERARMRHRELLFPAFGRVELQFQGSALGRAWTNLHG